MPEDAWRPRRRDERIAAALAGLRAEREAAEAERAQQAADSLRRQGEGRPGPPPAAVAVEAAQVRLERARAGRAAQIAELERRAAGPLVPGSRRDRPRAGVEDFGKVKEARGALAKAGARAAAAAEKQKDKDKDRAGPVRNITDPDARLMPVRGGGFIEGYNTQNVTSQDELIIATELTCDTTGTAWFQPMMAAAEDAARLITAHHAAAGHHTSPGSGGTPGPGYRPPPPDGSDTTLPAWLITLFLPDAGYCSQDNINAPGPPQLIATGKLRDLEKTAAQPGHGAAPWASPALAAMAALLATPEGIAAYRQRGHIAETPHGNIKHNMRFRQLSVRGKPKAAAEWTFAAAVHNLFKAITSGHLTAETLNRLQHRAAYPPTTQPAPA